jgi:hypothetical protein
MGVDVLKLLLRGLWALVKACLFIIEAIFAGIDSGGKAARRGALSWGQDNPPTHDRTCAYYNGPGRRP